MADVDAKVTKDKNEKKAEAKKVQNQNAKKPAPKGAPKTGFFKSVSIELKKVHWPDKEKVVKYTGVVFGVVVALGIVVWALDTAFSAVLSLIVG